MSDIYNYTAHQDKIAHKTCHVAYTINNLQPVSCTIIGEEPLFYMDFETEHEEDNQVFHLEDLNILKKELNELNHEIDLFDTFSQELLVDHAEKMDLFLSDAKDITDAQSQRETQYSDATSLIEILQNSRLAAAYLDVAREHGVALILSHQVETASYDPKSGHIIINAAMNKIDQIFLVVRELRRHWQHRQNALLHPLTFHPDNAILIHRAQTADLVVSIIRVAWELQLAGEKEAWDRIENSSMADMGRAFAREAFLDFRTINNGQAMAAVFESWFLSERCQAQDRILINQMLADHGGYVFDLEQSEPEVTPALIARLGAMPFGKNYLAEHASTIMDDAIFTDVRDRSNANFFWFIKFERTFRETEQELQNSEDLKTENIQSSVFPSEHQDHINDVQQPDTAEIITLFSDTSTDHRTKSTSCRDIKDHVSNIIYLRCWSGQ